MSGVSGASIAEYTDSMMRVFACLFAGLLVLGADTLVAQASEGTVRGRVVDEDAGEPVGRANVLVPRRDGRPGTSTDENGHYQISLPPGEYILEVSALRYHGIRRTIALEEGETVRFDLELSPRDYSLNEIVVSEEQRAEEPVSTVQHVEYATLESQDAASVSELAELVPATHVQTNSRGQTIWYFRKALLNEPNFLGNRPRYPKISGSHEAEAYWTYGRKTQIF